MGYRLFCRPQISFPFVGFGGLGLWDGGIVRMWFCGFVCSCIVCLGLWVCEFVGVWVCGFVGLWVCASLCLCVVCFCVVV